MFSRRLFALVSFLTLLGLATCPRPSSAERPRALPLTAFLAADDSHGDPLPPRDALKRLGTVRFRTGDGILSLAYSPDGKYIASGGRNDVVRLWEADTGKLVRTFKEHWIWALTFSPDGKYLATGGANKIARLWDVESGKELFQMRGHKASIKAVTISRDNGTLLTAGDDNTIRLWRVGDGSQVAVVEGHTFGVNAVAVAPNVKNWASGSTDRTLRIWENPRAVMHAPSAIQALAYFPDSKTVISAGDDGFIRTWDIATAKEIRAWKGHTGTINHLLLSADGKTLVTGGSDKMVRIWDVTMRTEIRSMQRRQGDCDALAMSADGKFIAAGGSNNTVHRWEIATGNELQNAAPTAEGAITGMACSADGNLVAAAYSTNQVQLIDLNSGKERHRLICGPDDAEVLVAFAPDGKAVATASAPDTIVLWDTATGKEKQRLVLPERDEVRCLSYSPGGEFLAVGYTGGGLRIWDVAAGKVVKNVPFPRGAVAVAYARDGKTLAVGTEDAILLFSTGTYQPLRQYAKLNDTVACLAFAPDGRYLAAGMYANTIRLFDLTVPKEKTDVEPRALEGHQGVVYSLAWSINGRCLASAGFDRTVRVWEFVNGQQIASWVGHQGEVSAIAFHPHGRKVVSASHDTTLLVWDATMMGDGGNLPKVNNLEPLALDQMWKELASDNNTQGNKALWTLVAGNKSSTPYLSKKVFLADPKKIHKYINDLNSNIFKEREMATAALASYERWVEGVLRKTLEDPPSEEVRQRVEKLLQRLVGKDAISLQQERLRVRRIIEVLEQSGTAEARALLGQLANGAAEEDLRDMAQAAYDRMGKR